jgi:hypothetical protein
MRKALPFLEYVSCCMKAEKKNFRYGLRKSLLHRLDIKIPKSELKLEDDPYLRLGI